MKIKIIVLTLIGIVIIASYFFAIDNKTTENNDEIFKASIEAPEKLLDSWKGQNEILDQAKALIDDELNKNPNNYEAYKQLARFHIMQGYLYSNNNGNFYDEKELLKAEMALNKAIDIKPDFADGYVLFGHLYINQKKYAAARTALGKAEAIGTKNPWLHLNWADLFIEEGKPDEAFKHYKKIIDDGTTNKKALSSAYDFLIDYYKKNKDYENVKSIYKLAFELDPESIYFRNTYSNYIRRELGEIDSAIFYAKESLRIFDNRDGRYALAMSLYAKWAQLKLNESRSMEAKKCFDEAYELYQDLNHVMAIEGGYLHAQDMVKALMSIEVSIDSSDEQGDTALADAAFHGRVEAVRSLLSLGASPNTFGNNGWNPLLGAIDEGYYEIVKLLLEYNADVHQKMGNMTALDLAKKNGNTSIIELVTQYKG